MLLLTDKSFTTKSRPVPLGLDLADSVERERDPRWNPGATRNTASFLTQRVGKCSQIAVHGLASLSVLFIPDFFRISPQKSAMFDGIFIDAPIRLSI
jgi:hypothetical protein